MASVLKSGANEKVDKAANKLDTLLGSLLSKMPEHQPEWHTFLFKENSGSALHIDRVQLNLSDATKKAIHQFKTRQLISPLLDGEVSPELRKEVVQFHCDLYAVAFKGKPSPFAANAEFFPHYVIDLLKTRPDKFRFARRMHDPKSLEEHDGLKPIIEDAFVHLGESTPMRDELREALLCLGQQDEVPTLDQTYRKNTALQIEIGNEMKSASRDASVAMRDLAFGNGRFDYKDELQRRLILRMEGKQGKHWSFENDEILKDLLCRSAYLKDHAASPSADKSRATGNESDAAMRFKTALIRRIEDRIFTMRNQRESLSFVERVVKYYLGVLKEEGAEQRREASMLESTIYRFLQKNLIRDPDALQALAGHLRSGDMSLRGATPVINDHGPQFLLDFCSFRRIPMLSLLSKNDNLGALTSAQLHDILLERELLIPASSQDMENEFGSEAKAKFRDALLLPACAALLQPQIMQPVADQVKGIFFDIYRFQLPDASYRQLMQRLLRSRADQYNDLVHQQISGLLDSAAGSYGRSQKMQHDIERLMPGNLVELLARHIAALAPGAEQYKWSAANSLMVHAFQQQASAADQSIINFFSEGLSRSTLNAIESALASGEINDEAIAAVKNAVSGNPTLAQLQDEKLLSHAAQMIMSIVNFIDQGLSRSTLNAIESALASGEINDEANAAVKSAITGNPALAKLQNEKFLSEAAKVIMSSVDEKRKVFTLAGMMQDLDERQQFFYPMEREHKKALAEELAKLDGKAIMAAKVIEWLTQFWPLLAQADAGQMRKTADTILEYREWPKLVLDKADGRNHFEEEIETFEKRLHSLPNRAHASDGDVAQLPDIWGPFIDRTLPFRNPGNVRRLLGDKNAHLPPDVVSKLAFARQYFKDIGADPDDPDETPLKAFVIGHSTDLSLLAVDELHFLNAHNVRDNKEQHFSLRVPVPGRQGQWAEKLIDLENVAAMDVPWHIRKAIIVNHPSASAFESAIFEVFEATTGENGLQISEREKNSLRLCFQKVAIDFREPLPPIVLNKSALRDLTGDVQLEVEFTELRKILLKNDLPTTATTPIQLSDSVRNPASKLPAKLVAGMEKSQSRELSSIAQVLETQAGKLAMRYDEHAAQHEIYFMLGLMLMRLSGVDGLGFYINKSGTESQSFVRFQLMANYCLAKCIVQSDQSIEGKRRLNSQEKAYILEHLELASTIGTCTRNISNSLVLSAPNYMKPLIDRALYVLRLASTEE